MIKYIKEMIHYTLIYAGINIPIYFLFKGKYHIDLYSDFIYTVIFIAICVFISNLINSWYKLKD